MQLPHPTHRCRRRRLIFILSVILVLAGLSGCVRRGQDSGPERETGAVVHAQPAADVAHETAREELPPLRIAEQHGLAYAPLAIMRIDRILEHHVERPVEWVRLGNATAIREAMLAGRLDVGFMGIPPYLIGRDRGMEWDVFTGLARAPIGLVTLDPTIASLSDLIAAGPRARVALPQPGSIQHILLALALEGEGLPAAALDTRLVSLGHPDGMTALLAGGEVRAHFTAPPFLTRELAEPGARLLVRGTEAFGGPFTFIIGVSSAEETIPIAAVRAAVEEAIGRLQRLQQQADLPAEGTPDGRLLTDLAADYELSRAALHLQLREDGVDFDTAVDGIARFEEAMRRLGYLTGEV